VVLKFAPWGSNPGFDWDDNNENKIWSHRIRDFEVEECFENNPDVMPHEKTRTCPEKYSDRFLVKGKTNGGRKLVIVVQYLGANFVRPITAWDE